MRQGSDHSNGATAVEFPLAEKPVVMIVDDHYRTLQTLPRLISSEDFTPLWVSSARHALELMKNHADAIRIIVIDLKTSGMGGGGFLHHVRQCAPDSAVLVIGPLGPILYQDGSFYEPAGPSLKRDINTILAGIVQKQNAKSASPGVPESNRKDRYGVIIGKSKRINEIYGLLDNLKKSDATVLIQGESGTGKELVARAIHNGGLRKSAPFVAINCGAIPPSLMESELFGHERGAFTSAVHLRKGKFEVAEGGTLFLDEIGELEKDLQVKLLRVLQEREFMRVGGNRNLRTNVRIIAATSQDLRKSVAEGYFRDDLYYRLHVVPINLPPLRERREDIPLLLDHFVKKYADKTGLRRPLITSEAREAIYNYSYPGNVRELMNIVERIFVLCTGDSVTLQTLPAELRPEPSGSRDCGAILKPLPSNGIRLEAVERELIMKTIELTGGNKTAAARVLGMTRRRLYLRLSQYRQVVSEVAPHVAQSAPTVT